MMEPKNTCRRPCAGVTPYEDLNNVVSDTCMVKQRAGPSRRAGGRGPGPGAGEMPIGYYILGVSRSLDLKSSFSQIPRSGGRCIPGAPISNSTASVAPPGRGEESGYVKSTRGSNADESLDRSLSKYEKIKLAVMLTSP